MGKHQLYKEIKIATKGSLQTEMNISHSNHDVIFFFLINFKSGTVNKSRELKFSNEINKHSTRNWYKINWFSEREREREISLSTVRHCPHFDGWDQYHQEIQNMMDNIKEI